MEFEINRKGGELDFLGKRKFRPRLFLIPADLEFFDEEIIGSPIERIGNKKGQGQDSSAWQIIISEYL